MEALVFDRETLDELNDQAKDPKQKVIAAHKAEDLVFDLFQSDFPDLRRVNKTPGAMDMYSYRYKLRIEVKTKHNENIHALEQKFLANIKLHREDMSFVYINIAPHKRTHFFSSKVYIINGYELTKSMYQLLVSNIKEKFDNPSMFKNIQEATGEDSQDIQEIVSHFDEKLAHLESLILKNEDGVSEAAETAEGSAEDDVSEAAETAELTETIAPSQETVNSTQVETVIEEVFMENFQQLHDEFISSTELRNKVNTKLVSRGLTFVSASRLAEYLKSRGCPERRFHLNPNNRKETTRVFAFQTQTAIEGRARNGAHVYADVLKELEDIDFAEIKPNFETFVFYKSTERNRNRGVELIQNPRDLISFHRTFYQKQRKTPSNDDYGEYNGSVFSLSEQLAYIKKRIPVLYQLLMEEVYYPKSDLALSYEDEYQIFMKNLQECVSMKKPFIESYFHGLKRRTSVYRVFCMLKFPSERDRKTEVSERIQVYDRHKSEINTFMLKNREVIEKNNLHAATVNRNKVNGEKVVNYCYDFRIRL